MAKKIKSSNVTSYSYDKNAEKLNVTFHGGNAPGRKYVYRDVSPETYKKITSAKSKGSAVWKELRDTNAPYKKVNKNH